MYAFGGNKDIQKHRILWEDILNVVGKIYIKQYFFFFFLYYVLISLVHLLLCVLHVTNFERKLHNRYAHRQVSVPTVTVTHIVFPNKHHRNVKLPTKTYLVCLLPLRSCCATEAHFSASWVTNRRCRNKSLSGNFLISDSSIKALKFMRPLGG